MNKLLQRINRLSKNDSYCFKGLRDCNLGGENVLLFCVRNNKYLNLSECEWDILLDGVDFSCRGDRGVSDSAGILRYIDCFANANSVIFSSDQIWKIIKGELSLYKDDVDELNNLIGYCLSSRAKDFSLNEEQGRHVLELADYDWTDCYGYGHLAYALKLEYKLSKENWDYLYVNNNIDNVTYQLERFNNTTRELLKLSSMTEEHILTKDMNNSESMSKKAMIGFKV